jgi:hypothetical protein
MPNITLKSSDTGIGYLLVGTPTKTGSGSFSCTINEENVDGSPFQGYVV